MQKPGAHARSWKRWRATWGCGPPLSPAGRMNVALGRAFAPRDVGRLYDQRAALVRATMAALDEVEVLAMPTTAIPPASYISGAV